MILLRKLFAKIYLFLVFAVFATGIGCSNKAQNDAAHDHSNTFEPVQYTAYSDHFEVFAEASPFILGKPTPILAHFTQLRDFAPLQGGKVVMSLVIGSSGIRQTCEAPLRKGIYQFSLNPVAAGTGEIYFDIYKSDTIYHIALAHIEVFENEHEAAHSIAPVHHPGNAILFTKEQSWKVNFRTAPVTEKNFGRVINAAGVISSAPQNKKLITASSSGVVTMMSSLVKGSELTKGDLLFRISGDKLSENNSAVRFIEAKNNFESAEAKLKRMQSLANNKIVAEQELLDAKKDFKNAAALYDNLRKNFIPEGMDLISPMTGYISELLISNGSYVESGTVLAVIKNNQDILLTADVSPEDSKQIQRLKSVYIKINNDGNYRSIDYILVSTGKAANTDNYLVPVTLKPEGYYELIPGEIVAVKFQTNSNSKSIVVPEEALIEEQGNYFIMVQRTPELFEKRLVKKGPSNGLETIILNGIKPGERIVTVGALMVKLSQSSGALDPHAGHAH